MIILLTGKPGIGKSTAIRNFISLNALPAEWVITEAIIDPATGTRAGFRAENSDNVERIISHKTDIESDAVVGENRVDTHAVDAMFAHILNTATTRDDTLTIVDEIGPIQLLSDTFSDSLERALSSRADIVATIHFSDERLSRYRESPDNILLEVTELNRNILPNALVALTENSVAFHTLTSGQQALFRRLVAQYVEQAHLLQIRKLTSNAIQYVNEGNVQRINDTHWYITGRHGAHDVSLTQAGLSCDCDLFNGRNEYTDIAGECSHVQAVKLFNET